MGHARKLIRKREEQEKKKMIYCMTELFGADLARGLKKPNAPL
jgi:hypothetical protein